MRNLSLVAILLSSAFISVQSQADTSVFNILSLDGGGIRGLITAQVVEYLENETYSYALTNYCIP